MIPTMLDTSYLYDPIRNRYKGVYANRNPALWDAITFSPDGKLLRRGTFFSQEEAAQVVARYYCEVYGPDWPDLLEDRKRRYWRIRRMDRTAHCTVYIAEVRNPGDKNWYRVEDADISVLPVSFSSITDTSVPGWSWAGKGWVSAGAALVAIRTYRYIHHLAPTLRT